MLTVLGSGKPLTYEWDVANQEATAIAAQKFNELAASGGWQHPLVQPHRRGNLGGEADRGRLTHPSEGQVLPPCLPLLSVRRR
jgi:hypothetical protein